MAKKKIKTTEGSFVRKNLFLPIGKKQNGHLCEFFDRYPPPDKDRVMNPGMSHIRTDRKKDTKGQTERKAQKDRQKER